MKKNHTFKRQILIYLLAHHSSAGVKNQLELPTIIQLIQNIFSQGLTSHLLNQSLSFLLQMNNQSPNHLFSSFCALSHTEASRICYKGGRTRPTLNLRRTVI